MYEDFRVKAVLFLFPHQCGGFYSEDCASILYNNYVYTFTLTYVFADGVTYMVVLLQK